MTPLKGAYILKESSSLGRARWLPRFYLRLWLPIPPPDGVIDILLGTAVGLDEFLVTVAVILERFALACAGLIRRAPATTADPFRSVDVPEHVAWPHAAADVVIHFFR